MSFQWQYRLITHLMGVRISTNEWSKRLQLPQLDEKLKTHAGIITGSPVHSNDQHRLPTEFEAGCVHVGAISEQRCLRAVYTSKHTTLTTCLS
jgi:hypothetical protein